MKREPGNRNSYRRRQQQREAEPVRLDDPGDCEVGRKHRGRRG